jgi:hypothetical protein
MGGAPGGAADTDLCRVAGHARISYRRAAELFTALTRPLDTAGGGWTLHQLSASGRSARPSGYVAAITVAADGAARREFGAHSQLTGRCAYPEDAASPLPGGAGSGRAEP